MEEKFNQKTVGALCKYYEKYRNGNLSCKGDYIPQWIRELKEYLAK